MNTVDTHIDVVALDGETAVEGTGQFAVWDDMQEKWMIGTFPFEPNERFTHIIKLHPISERIK